VRRCVKLPYRYVDEVTATVPGYFNPQHLHTFPSILLMTMVEQWCAKVAGSHMSSEAAGVVAHVVGRILLGLVGKMRDMVFVTAVLGRMQGTLDAMRKEGKAKEGLEQLLQGIAGDLGKVDQTVQAVDGQDQPKLLAELLDER
jgi:nucleolar pre-ribosomal-associated protein 1